MITPTDVEDLRLEADFTVQKSLSELLQIPSYVVSGQPTSGLGVALGWRHRQSRKAVLAVHAVDVESWVYALLRPYTAYRLVTGEYVDVHKTVLQENVGCYKASESRTDDSHGLVKGVKPVFLRMSGHWHSGSLSKRQLSSLIKNYTLLGCHMRKLGL